MTVASPFDVWSAPVAVSWSFGDGASATGTSVTHAYAHPGTYTVSVTATDAAGNTTSDSGSITVSPPAGSPTSGASLTSSAGGTLRVSALSLSPTRFHRGKRTATVSRRAPERTPSATTISFSLSAAARATLGFELAAPGILAGRRCVARSRSHSKGRRCTRYTPLPHRLTITAHAGTDRVTFDGVLDGGARLAPGSYRLTLTAADGAASVTASQRPMFTLLS
jgi:uncharacterized membrane protein